MRSLCVLLVCLLVFSVVSADVKNLKSSNFDSTLKKTDFALVKFFAPWCGHCKKLAPEFKSAAGKLGGKALLAEVNCEEEKELCSKYEVRGYPTLLIFRNGEKSEDYSGGRTSPEIVKYMIANSGPAVTEVSTKAEFDKVPVADAKVLVMTKSADSALAKTIAKAAQSMRSSLTFVVTTTQKVAPKAPMESVTVYRPDDEPEVFEAGEEVNRAKLSDFLKRARIPLLAAVGPSNIQMYNELGGANIGWLFLDKEGRDKFIKEATGVAKKFREDLIMLWVDTVQFGMVAEQLAVPKGSKFPAFVIDKNRKHHVHPLDQTVTAKSMTEFIEKYLKGEVPATIKSEPVPSPETADGLTTLVGNNFKKTLAKGKDTMILFYAPWCGHCKTFHPIYDKVAKAFEKSDVIIAKMDATTNDVDSDSVKIQGFPTIYFFKADGSDPISYSGDRSFEDVTKFIKDHASSPAEPLDEADL